MQDSRIEQRIEDIYAFVESCKMQALSTSKVIVPKNELYDLLDDLRRDVPDEIQRYQKMLNQRDAILENAEERANSILQDAQEQRKAITEDHYIMQEANRQAQEMLEEAGRQAQAIVENARKQAEEIGAGAIYYTSDMMDMAERVIASAYESTVKNSQALENALMTYLDTIRQNKAELIQSNPDMNRAESKEQQYSDDEIKSADGEVEYDHEQDEPLLKY